MAPKHAEAFSENAHRPDRLGIAGDVPIEAVDPSNVTSAAKVVNRGRVAQLDAHVDEPG